MASMLDSVEVSRLLRNQFSMIRISGELSCYIVEINHIFWVVFKEIATG